MSEKASWTVQLQIQGSKPINLSGQLQADAFDKMSPAIPAASNGTPGTRSVPVDAGAKLLLVSTQDTSEKLTVAFAGANGQPISQPVTLSQGAPLFLVGPQLIDNQANGGAKRTTQLTFGSSSTQKIVVDILVLSDLA